MYLTAKFLTAIGVHKTYLRLWHHIWLSVYTCIRVSLFMFAELPDNLIKSLFIRIYLTMCLSSINPSHPQDQYLQQLIFFVLFPDMYKQRDRLMMHFRVKDRCDHFSLWSQKKMLGLGLLVVISFCVIACREKLRGFSYDVWHFHSSVTQFHHDFYFEHNTVCNNFIGKLEGPWKLRNNSVCAMESSIDYADPMFSSFVRLKWVCPCFI